MSLNGIWKIEMLGPYGWETVATAFLQDGDYKAASQDHYTLGRYEVDGDKIEITAVSNAHGQVRTLFGEQRQTIEMQFEGKIDGDQITGQARDDKAKYLLSFRATRLADVP